MNLRALGNAAVACGRWGRWLAACGAIFGLVLICLPVAAHADFRQDGIECLRSWEARQLDRAIAACTRAIESKQVSGELLGTTYWIRGNAYRAKNDLDHALADYSRS